MNKQPQFNMPSSLYVIALSKAVERVPGLRRLPVAKLLILAQVALLARDHIERLSPKERRRLVTILRETKGLPSNLTPSKRRELEALVAKAEPKLFMRTAAEMFSPVPLRGRFSQRR